VGKVLKAGYRTADIADANTSKDKILNTQQMGTQVVNHLAKI
jgi:3-isopropylmalate dehydrogenase